MHIAALHPRVDQEQPFALLVFLFDKSEIDVTALDSDGKTALHLAVESSAELEELRLFDTELARRWLPALNARSHGRTPYELAVALGEPQWADSLTLLAEDCARQLAAN
jgi:hypothetical protein